MLLDLQIPFEGDLVSEAADFVVLDDGMQRDSDKQQVFELMAVALEKLSPIDRVTLLAWQHKDASSE